MRTYNLNHERRGMKKLIALFVTLLALTGAAQQPAQAANGCWLKPKASQVFETQDGKFAIILLRNPTSYKTYGTWMELALESDNGVHSRQFIVPAEVPGDHVQRVRVNLNDEPGPTLILKTDVYCL